MTRTYDSPLREERARETRERVLDAVIELLAGSSTAPEVIAVATKAGVSVPTVYRYFPNREALMDATRDHLSARIGRPAYPADPEAFARTVPERIAFYDRNEADIRAALASPDLQAALVRRRRALIGETLGPATRHLPEEDARAIHALLNQLSDAHTWAVLRDEWGLDSATIARAAAWATDTLLQQLHEDKEP